MPLGTGAKIDGETAREMALKRLEGAVLEEAVRGQDRHVLAEEPVSTVVATHEGTATRTSVITEANTNTAVLTTSNTPLSTIPFSPPVDAGASDHNLHNINISQQNRSRSNRNSHGNPARQTPNTLNISSVPQLPATTANLERLQRMSREDTHFSRPPPRHRNSAPAGNRDFNLHDVRLRSVHGRSPFTTSMTVGPEHLLAADFTPSGSCHSHIRAGGSYTDTPPQPGISQNQVYLASTRPTSITNGAGPLLATGVVPSDSRRGHIFAGGSYADTPPQPGISQDQVHESNARPASITIGPDLLAAGLTQTTVCGSRRSDLYTGSPHIETPGHSGISQNRVDRAKARRERNMWLDGACDTEDESDGDGTSSSFGSKAESTGNNLRGMIGYAGDLDDQSSVEAPQRTQSERSITIQENAVVDGAMSAAVKASRYIRGDEDGNEVAQDKDWVDIPANTQKPGPSPRDLADVFPAGPSDPGRFVRSVNRGPRRGSYGIPAYNPPSQSLNNTPMASVALVRSPNLQSGVQTSIRKRSKGFELGGKLRRITRRWIGGNRKHASKQQSDNASRRNQASGTINPAAVATEDDYGLSLLGYVAPLGPFLSGNDIAEEEELPAVGDNPTGSGSGQSKVSRLKKLKSLASFSNIAAAFKQGESAKLAIDRVPGRMTISGPVSTSAHPAIVWEANRVRQQMMDVMSGFEGGSLASARYAGTMPGTMLGEGAIRVDPDGGLYKGNSVKNSQQSMTSGVGESSKKPGKIGDEGTDSVRNTPDNSVCSFADYELNSLQTAGTLKKPLALHTMSSTGNNAVRPTTQGSVDPHEGRGYEGIWSGPGIAVNTPEGGIRIIPQPLSHIEETSDHLDPHPGVRFHIPDDAPEPRPPGIMQTGNSVPYSSVSDPFGYVFLAVPFCVQA